MSCHKAKLCYHPRPVLSSQAALRDGGGAFHIVSKSEKAPLENVAVAFSGHYSFLGLSLCEMLTALLVLHGSRERCADENPPGDVAPHNRAARRSLQRPRRRMKMWLNGKRLLSLGVHKNKNLVS